MADGLVKTLRKLFATWFRNPMVRAILRITAGWIFLVLGLLGLFLPLLQGILFLAIGAYLLAPHVPFFARLRAWFYRKFPATERAVHRLQRKFRHKAT